MAGKTKAQKLDELSSQYNELYLRSCDLEYKLTGTSGPAKRLLLEFAETILKVKEVQDEMAKLSKPSRRTTSKDTK